MTSQRGDRLGAAACVVVGAFVLSLSWFKLSGVDLGYHLAYGRHFLETGRIVERDPFLLPGNAEPFVNANWGSQIIMALVERAAGAGGLVVLRIGLIACIFACMAAAIRRSGCGWTAVAIAWLLACLGAYERFTLRPELFSYAILAALFALLAGRGLPPRTVAAVAALQCLWVNLHSYFLVGLMLTACRLAGEIAARWGRGSNAEVDTSCRTGVAGRGGASAARGAAVALLIQTIVCVINPAGLRGAVFPLRTLDFLRTGEVIGSGPEAPQVSSWSAISEFHAPLDYIGYPVNHRTISAWLALASATVALLLVYAVAGVMRLLFGQTIRLDRALERACLLAVFLAMSLAMRRNIAQFALVAAPILVAAAAGMLHAVPPGRIRSWGRAAAALGATGAAAAWIVAVADGRFYFAERRINREFGAGYSERAFPLGAAAWLARHPDVQPNLFVDYFASSNVLPWLPGRYKLFVDTNTFAYDEAVLAEADAVGLGQRDYAAFFTQHEMNAALLSVHANTEPLVRRLAADLDWALVYFDRHYVIFLRRMHEHVPITKANKPAAATFDPAAWSATIRGPRRVRALELATSAGVPIALGWHRAAITLLDEAVRLAPDYEDAWNNLGVCHGNLAQAAARQGRLAEALVDYQRAADCFAAVLRLDPAHPTAERHLTSTRSVLDYLKQGSQ